MFYKRNQFSMQFSGMNANRVITFYKDQSVPFNFYRKQPYLVRVLLYRQQRDMNTFVLCVGNVRSGKSSFILELCKRLSLLKGVPFDVNKQLTFDDIKKFLIWSKTAKGSMFILDETGTSLSPEQFWDLQQRVMRRFVQTQGFRRNILFWVLPSVILIQKAFRFMCNYGVQTKFHGLVSVHKIKMDNLKGKGWFEYVGVMRYKKPTGKVWDDYMREKEKWNDEQLKNDIDYLDQASKPDQRQLMRDENLKLTLQLKRQRIEYLTKKNKDML